MDTIIDGYKASVDGVKWFAYFFLEGQVCPKLKRFVPSLLTTPGSITKSWARLIPRTQAIVQTLQSQGVVSKYKLLEIWGLDEKYFQIYFLPIMVYCAIKGCKNDSKKTKNSSCRKISYFRFLKNQLWKEWVKFCGNPKINLATARVCSVHFPEGAYREKTWVQQQYPELMRSCTKLTSQGIIEIDCNENSIVSLGETNITSQLTSLEIQDSIPAGSSQSEDFIEDSNQLELLEKLERLKEENKI
ncbi:uncharacterized protein LOC143898212 isoform X2 [Temnothorax americanus]|uniref:uncharacterized protein LOC143898212 isoform X2 n=1 Tax=Temnothorax americanus TaxID=1964332 RepID=UPI004067FD67